MNTPCVSVCIPTYNRAHHLPQAIESILAQTFGDFELVISDNASTDHTSEVLQRYRDLRIRVHRNATNLGLVGNFNRCVELARAPHVVLCCSDDYWAPHLLEREMALLEQNPGLTYVHTGSIVITGEEQIRNLLPLDAVTPGRQFLIRFLLEDLNGTNFSSALYPTRILREAGGFDPSLPHTQDLAVWARMALRGDVGYIAEPLVFFRKHSNNYHMCWQWEEYLSERFLLLDEIFSWPEASGSDVQASRDLIYRATVSRALDAFAAMRLEGVRRKSLLAVWIQCLRRDPSVMVSHRGIRAAAALLLSPAALQKAVSRWGRDSRRRRAAGVLDPRAESPAASER